MKRGDFIKNIFTLVAVPTLAGGLIPVNPFSEEKPQVFNESDVIRFYGDRVGKYRLGDIILSDMGDTACIVRIIITNEPYAEARPVQKGVFRYKNIGDIHVLGNSIMEKI